MLYLEDQHTSKSKFKLKCNL